MFKFSFAQPLCHWKSLVSDKVLLLTEMLEVAFELEFRKVFTLAQISKKKRCQITFLKSRCSGVIWHLCFEILVKAKKGTFKSKKIHCLFLNPNTFIQFEFIFVLIYQILEISKNKLKKQKLFWPFTAWINCSSDLKNFANSQISASNFKSFFDH